MMNNPSVVAEEPDYEAERERVEREANVLRPLPIEVCRYFWAALVEGSKGDQLASIADNPVAELLRPTPQPLIDTEKVRLPVKII